MNVPLAIRLAVVTVLAVVAFFGSRQLDDDIVLPLPTVVLIVWLAGVAKILHAQYWYGFRFRYGWRLTTLAHAQAIAYLAISTALAVLAYSGVRSPDGPPDWRPWLIASALLLGALFFIPTLRNPPLMVTLEELAAVSGLGTGTVAAIWLLDGHTDRLPWVIAGVWLVSVIGCIGLRDEW